jgi:hypothetical protein
LRGLVLSPVSITVQAVSRKDAKVVARYRISAYQELDKSGTVTGRFEATPRVVDAMTLTNTVSGWMVKSVTRLPQ